MEEWIEVSDEELCNDSKEVLESPEWAPILESSDGYKEYKVHLLANCVWYCEGGCSSSAYSCDNATKVLKALQSGEMPDLPENDAAKKSLLSKVQACEGGLSSVTDDQSQIISDSSAGEQDRLFTYFGQKMLHNVM